MAFFFTWMCVLEFIYIREYTCVSVIFALSLPFYTPGQSGRLNKLPLQIFLNLFAFTHGDTVSYPQKWHFRGFFHILSCRLQKSDCQYAFKLSMSNLESPNVNWFVSSWLQLEHHGSASIGEPPHPSIALKTFTWPYNSIAFYQHFWRNTLDLHQVSSRSTTISSTVSQVHSGRDTSIH